MTQRDRAGVFLIRNGHIALIERVHAGRQYWVIPGGGIEPGETPREAAAREAAEELGSRVSIGQLRVRVRQHDDPGEVRTEYYFDAVTDSDQIEISGPETDPERARGTYRAVWVPVRQIDVHRTFPSAISRWVVLSADAWPDHIVDLDMS